MADTRCWACHRDIPDEHSYSLLIRKRWGHRDISLGVVLCMDCRFRVSACLATIQDEAEQKTDAAAEGVMSQ